MKFLAPTVLEIWRKYHNFKSSSRYPGVESACQDKFDVSRSKHSRDMEGVPKFQK